MTADEPRLALTWPADSLDVTAARHRFVDWLRLSASGAAIEDLSLIVTELISNARDASSGLGGTIDFDAQIHDRAVVVRVTNLADQRDLDRIPPLAVLPEPTSTRGRGLAIVARLADSLDVNIGPDRISVTASRRLIDSSGEI